MEPITFLWIAGFAVSGAIVSKSRKNTKKIDKAENNPSGNTEIDTEKENEIRKITESINIDS